MSRPNQWCPKSLLELINSQSVYAPDQSTRNKMSELVRILNVHRPVASNGKHGDLHTPTCGCER